MSKKVKSVLSEIKTVESQLNINQVCNEFRLTGTTRIHVLKKFKTEKHTLKEWDIIFHRERVTA